MLSQSVHGIGANMRRNGQTFRALLGALKLASEGKHIIYECPSIGMASWTFDKAVRLVSDFMDPVTPEAHLLKIGEGSVRFVGRVRPDVAIELSRSRKHTWVRDLYVERFREYRS